MNSVSAIPAPVAAQILGPGSFFGSCQIASGNFEDILNAMSEGIMPELPTAICDSGNLAEPEHIPSPFALQDFDKSEVLMQLQQVLGEDAGAEAFGRIINLLEKGTLSVQADTINWDKDTFEKLTVSLLERLDIAIKQITKAPDEAQEYEYENNSDMEKFLNLITDLLKTGMISPQEYETALKNPEESSLPELLGELKKETGKLIEKLENIETEPTEQPRQAEKPENPEKPARPRHVEQFAQTEIPRRAEQPKQTELPERAEWPRQMQAEQPKQAEQPIQSIPIYTEQPRQIQVEQPRQMQAEQPRQAEQPIQSIPIYTEQPRQVQIEQPRQIQAEQPRQAEQPIQSIPIYTEQPRQVQIEQPKQAVEQPMPMQAEYSRLVQTEQREPLLEELRVISMEMEIETEVKSKDKVKFYELLNNLQEKGLISEKDLKNAIKSPVIDNEGNSFEPNYKSEESKEGKETKAEKIEPAIIRNVLEKLWTNLENANKTEKENIFSKFREVVEAKNMSSERIDIKSAKVEPEIRAVWEAGDLKIETINPKTGEKLQSIPVANSHGMQERIHEFEVVRQVVSQAKFITTPTGEQRLTMQLRPEHLGQMNLRIILNNGEMQIHARVESTTAQAALESHIGLLREGLEKQGINLDRLEVSVEQRDKQDAFSLAERGEQQERQGKGRHHRNKEMHLAVSVKSDANSDTGRRLGYNTMEYLA